MAPGDNGLYWAIQEEKASQQLLMSILHKCSTHFSSSPLSAFWNYPQPLLWGGGEGVGYQYNMLTDSALHVRAEGIMENQ